MTGFKKILTRIVLGFCLVSTLHCTQKVSIATEVSCTEVLVTTQKWSEQDAKFVALSEKPASPERVMITGIGNKNPSLKGENFSTTLLSIKMDDVAGSYQFLEKAPLGTPNLWVYYPQGSKTGAKLTKDHLVRMRSFREKIPVTLSSVFECN